jgi:prepilin-type N-terminal cleavage/methylation domain-containing protein
MKRSPFERIEWIAGRFGRRAGRARPRLALTLIELLVVVGILSILSAIAFVNVQGAQVRAKVSASKGTLRTLAGGVEQYRIDWAAYPAPRPTLPGDPYGVLASGALRGLTTPVAYVSPAAFRDPFGELRMQVRRPGLVLNGDPFRPPEPGFNSDQSMLYMYYPYFAALIGNQGVGLEGYSLISIGPDLRDSLIAYFPFPAALPPVAAEVGVRNVHDSIYDPTNGAVSSGDIAWFGGDLRVPHLVGGGGP